VKPLRQIAITFPVSVLSLGCLAGIIDLQPPRSLLGFALSYLFPVLCVGFGWLFVSAFSRFFDSRSHSIMRFVLPILSAVILVVCAIWFGLKIGAIIHRAA
jgi:hypothetical protein